MNFLKGMGGAPGTGGSNKMGGGMLGTQAPGEPSKKNYFNSLKLKYIITNISSEP